ncbi:hypothetical protein ABK040_016852 [Willaertia magna]
MNNNDGKKREVDKEEQFGSMVASAQQMFDHVNVVLRLAQVPSEELKAEAQVIVEVEDTDKVIAYHPESREGLLYKFDKCFESDSSNQRIFEDVCIPVLNAVMEGINGAIIAYGTSKTGKTELFIGNEREEGIVDMTLREGFSYLTTIGKDIRHSITFSFWEMSNDLIIDLLDKEEKELKVKRNEEKGVYITNLSEKKVEGWEQLQLLIDSGIRRSQKLTAQRGIRLHSFMKLKLERDEIHHPEITLQSSLLFVNLKGAEKVGKMGLKGERLKHGASINKSITALENAIHNVENAVRKEKENLKSVFGDSIVTSVLSEALGGTFATVIIGSISQTEFHYLETMEVLENLRMAKRIKATPQRKSVETHISLLHKTVQKLESELQEDRLAYGHPPTEEQERLTELKERLKRFLQNPVKTFTVDELEKTQKLKIPAMRLPEGPLWKKNDLKSNRHGDRATIYKPKLTSKEAEKYTGQWKFHQKHGYGELIKENEVYKGEWREDKKDGKGVLYLKQEAKLKRVYKGDWHKGKKHGKGVYYYPNGEIYEGEWKNDVRSGYGVMYYSDGNKYEGMWENDKTSGSGVLFEKNGDKYEGGFYNGLKHGPGIYYYLTLGKKYVGEWFMGIPKCGQLSSEVYDEAFDNIPQNKLLDRNAVIEDAIFSVREQMRQEGVLPSDIKENEYD